MPKTATVNIKIIDMPEVQAVLEQLSDEITRLQRALTDKTVALAAAQIELIGSESVTLRNGWRDEVERLRAVWPQAHGIIGDLRGACTDELPHTSIDEALRNLDDLLYLVLRCGVPAETDSADSEHANG